MSASEAVMRGCCVPMREGIEAWVSVKKELTRGVCAWKKAVVARKGICRSRGS